MEPPPTGIVLLGYGPAGDLVEIYDRRQLVAARMRHECRKRWVTEREVSQFYGYAASLSVRYRFLGSGGDAADVQQEAIVAAWKALEEWECRRGSKDAYVKQRMKWGVLNFVGMRPERRGEQRRFDRFVEPLKPEHE